MMKYVAFNLILLIVFALQVSSQTILVNGKIPDDLLITLKRQGGWGGTYSEMTIDANGEFSYQTHGGNMPAIKMFDVLSIKGKREKTPKYLKPKLSEEKLKLLIAEFEKIQFFKFGKDFPVEDEKEILCVTDVGTEAISIRINGQAKEVSDYYGCSGKRSRLLQDLAERIRGAGIWNYENGEIPENFVISYQITEAGKIKRNLTIKSNGKVTESYFSVISSKFDEEGKPLLKYITKKIGKFSKQQINQLIEEFEKVGFSTFKYSTLNKYSGCSNDSVSTTEKRTHINVQINRVAQMYASLYENCDPKPETDAAKFEYINTIIKALLKNAGVKNIS